MRDEIIIESTLEGAATIEIDTNIMKPILENLTVIPTTEEQLFKSDKHGYDEVTVKGVTANIDENIKPEHIKEGVTILGVEGEYFGIDTTDATATAEDLLEGKTAYVNGEQITGTIKQYDELSDIHTDGAKQVTINTANKYCEDDIVVTVDTTEITVTPGTEDQVQEGVFDKVVIPGDANLTPDNIKADETIFDTTGTFTSDATATTNDILYDKTAYVNGKKIIGNIQPTYDPTMPEQVDKQIYYGAALNDMDLTYGIGIYCSGTNLCRIYRLEENTVASTYHSVSTADFSTSITFYTNVATLAHDAYALDGQVYLRAYVAAKNSSNVVGIASFLINVVDLTCSNFLFRAVSGQSWNNSGTTSHTPKIVTVPHTNNKCMIAYYLIGGADAWTHFQIQTFSRTSSSTKSVCWLGSNSSSTARGLNDTTMQFSEDGTLMVLNTSMLRYGGEARGNYVATSPDNWATITTLYQSEVGIYKNDTGNLYKLIDNNKVSNNNRIYSISNLNSYIGTLPYTATYQTRGIQIGSYLYHMENSTSTTISVYKINDTSLTLVSTLTAQAGKWFPHYGLEMLYVDTNNNITGYRLGMLGALIAMNRLGTDYYSTTDATATSDHIMPGKIAYTTVGKTVGTMPNRGARYITPGTSNITIPAGYHNGNGYVRGDADLIASNIKSGVNIFNVAGTYVSDITETTEYTECLDLTNQIIGGA